MRKWSILFLILLLIPVFALSESEGWYCPVCSGFNEIGARYCCECGLGVFVKDQDSLETPQPTEAPRFTEAPLTMETPQPTEPSRYFFGIYEQNNDLSDGPEPIEWLLLDYSPADGTALLLSKYGLDTRAYQHGTQQTQYPTWARSQIRSWLNKEFLQTAFINGDRSALVTVTNATHTYNNRSGGDDSSDTVWLLSREEVNRYLPDVADRKVTPTAYALARGANHYSPDLNEPIGTSWWWLRSPGYHHALASCVDMSGTVTDSAFVCFDSGVIRPAIRVNLSLAGLPIP